ncbi:MAG TPA: hypothetical protein VFY18_06330 [Candidatus Limnocylindrales bacterium]|nr:hypothetical protein [Candidatus Limnocylindrales bacterium]
MQPIAAYYVYIADDLARESRKTPYQVVAARSSLPRRIVAALSSVVRPIRRSASQHA